MVFRMRDTSRIRFAVKWLMLIAWMIIIFLFSNEVATISSTRSAVIVHDIINTLHVSLSQEVLTFLTRKAAHIFLYLVLGILIYNVVKEYRFTTKKAILLSILFSLSYAGFDEIHQSFISGRSGQASDVMIDATASTVGVAAYYLHRLHSNLNNCIHHPE
jgi:VanZ family protein